MYFQNRRSEKLFENFADCLKPNGLFDITKLAYFFGFEITEQKELPEFLNGVIIQDSEEKQLVVNDKASKNSKRYSIAYLLYYHGQESFDIKHLKSKEDSRASLMARLLLIPEAVLKTVYSDNNDDIKWLAGIFGVPCDVMKQRVEEISMKQKTEKNNKIRSSNFIKKFIPLNSKEQNK